MRPELYPKKEKEEVKLSDEKVPKKDDNQLLQQKIQDKGKDKSINNEGDNGKRGGDQSQAKGDNGKRGNQNQSKGTVGKEGNKIKPNKFG